MLMDSAFVCQLYAVGNLRLLLSDFYCSWVYCAWMQLTDNSL